MNPSFPQVTRIFLRHPVRQYSSIRKVKSSVLPLNASSFLTTEGLGARKRKTLPFSSQAALLHPQDDAKGEEKPQKAKRKTRSSAAKNSLRRVAVEAQRSRDGKESTKPSSVPFQTAPKVISLLLALKCQTKIIGHSRQ